MWQQCSILTYLPLHTALHNLVFNSEHSQRHKHRCFSGAIWMFELRNCTHIHFIMNAKNISSSEMSAGNNATDGGWIMHHFTLYRANPHSHQTLSCVVPVLPRRRHLKRSKKHPVLMISIIDFFVATFFIMLFKINATFPVTSYFLQTNSVVGSVTKPYVAHLCHIILFTQS